MSKRCQNIAVGGSAADPPHKAHLSVIKAMMTCGLFDKVIWIISGSRQDKHLRVCPNHRIAMTELLLRDLRIKNRPDLEVIYDDVYEDNKPTIQWLEILTDRFPKQTNIFWFTGSDSVMPSDKFGGLCEMQAKWDGGEKLYRQYPFVIIPRLGYYFNYSILPDNFIIVNVDLPNAASSQIRRLIFMGEKFEHMTTKPVAEYIKRHGLYAITNNKERSNA